MLKIKRKFEFIFDKKAYNKDYNKKQNKILDDFAKFKLYGD